MPLRTVIVTGAGGLIGSEAARSLENKGYRVIGVDNNMRKDFFGPKGDTTWNLQRLHSLLKNFDHYDLDIRNRAGTLDLVKQCKPAAIIHCAAQPSHEVSAHRPFDDFDVNATGTLNLLEAARQYSPESPFILMSTNKVYGDAPNRIMMRETETRFEYDEERYKDGIAEDFPIDQSTHSLFGASKVAADVMTQEYGRYFGMPTVCFRAGCVTGSFHSGVELHGFLSHLVKVIVAGEEYTIRGFGGKQVRDQIHCSDVVSAFEEFVESPQSGKVYNIGGGSENNASILECFALIEEISGMKVKRQYSDMERVGDHICYISNLANLRRDYPKWSITRSLRSIICELVSFEKGEESTHCP